MNEPKSSVRKKPSRAQILDEPRPIESAIAQHEIVLVGAILKLRLPLRPTEPLFNKPADRLGVILTKQVRKFLVAAKAFMEPVTKLMRDGARRKITIEGDNAFVFVQALPASAASRFDQLIANDLPASESHRFQFLQQCFGLSLNKNDVAELFWRHFDDHLSPSAREFLCKHRPVPAGTLIQEDGTGAVFRVCDDTTAHGAPWVEIIEPGRTDHKPGDRTVRTLYLHTGRHRIQGASEPQE